MYRIKADKDLRDLKEFGYKYCGNYNRGEQYVKEIDIIVYGKNLGGILIQEWREINFKFPYIKNIKYPDIRDYIQDLITAGYVEKVKEE